jgi:hypothetical protein
MQRSQRKALAEIFASPLQQAGFKRQSARLSWLDTLLYRTERGEYLRIDIDAREGMLLVNYGLGDGSPPRWDVGPESLNEFPLDMMFEGCDSDATNATLVKMDPIATAHRYASAIHRRGSLPALTPDLVDKLRASCRDHFREEDR